MRACFVLGTDLFRPSPIFRAVKEARALQRLGFECAAVCWIKRTPDLPPEETVDGIRVHRLFLAPSPQRATNVLRRYRELRAATRALAELVASLSPDVIIAHDLEALSSAVRASRGRVPLLYDAHEDWPAMVGETSRFEGLLSAALERRLCRRVGAVVTPSDPITAKFRAWGLRAETLHNAPYRSETEPLPDAETVRKTREELGLGTGFAFGYSGSVAPDRGLEVIVDALRILEDDVRGIVVGGPQEEVERVRSLAGERGVEDRMRFVGRVPRTDVPRYVSAFDLAAVLLPPRSRNYLQALPNKLYDYMAAGVPVLVSDLPALRRVAVDEAGCGIAVPPTPEQVAAAVRQLRDHPTDRAELGRRGREAFLTRYSWDHQEARFLDVLRSLGVRGIPAPG